MKLYVKFGDFEATSFATIEDQTAERDFENFTFEKQGFRPALASHKRLCLTDHSCNMWPIGFSQPYLLTLSSAGWAEIPNKEGKAGKRPRAGAVGVYKDIKRPVLGYLMGSTGYRPKREIIRVARAFPRYDACQLIIWT